MNNHPSVSLYSTSPLGKGRIILPLPREGGYAFGVDGRVH